MNLTATYLSFVLYIALLSASLLVLAPDLPGCDCGAGRRVAPSMIVVQPEVPGRCKGYENLRYSRCE